MHINRGWEGGIGRAICGVGVDQKFSQLNHHVPCFLVLETSTFTASFCNVFSARSNGNGFPRTSFSIIWHE